MPETELEVMCNIEYKMEPETELAVEPEMDLVVDHETEPRNEAEPVTSHK